MAVSKEDILETIANMSVMEVVDLISEMEEKFGVSAAAAVAAAPAAAGGEAAAAVEEHRTRSRKASTRKRLRRSRAILRQPARRWKSSKPVLFDDETRFEGWLAAACRRPFPVSGPGLTGAVRQARARANRR